MSDTKKFNAMSMAEIAAGVLIAMVVFKFLDVLFLNDWALKAKAEIDEE